MAENCKTDTNDLNELIRIIRMLFVDYDRSFKKEEEMKNKYGWLILGALACLFIFSGSGWYLCGQSTSNQIVEPTKKRKSTKKRYYGRLVVKFSRITPHWLKKKFFKKMKLEPIAYSVFGFDIAGWDKPEKIKKKINVYNEFHYLVSYFKNIDTSKVYVVDYEIETVEAKAKKQSGCQKPQNVYHKKLIVPWYEKYIQAEKAHDFLKKKNIPLTPNGVVIIDNGPLLSHPDLAPVLKKDKKGKVIFWAWDKEDVEIKNHGTHVGCLAVGYRNGVGVDGIAASGSYILPLIVRYRNRTRFFASDIAIGLKYFWELEKMGVIQFRVANMSFHMMQDSKIVYWAMKILKDKLFVVAAGNGRQNLDEDKLFYYPAVWNLPNKIVVGATRQDEKLARFSNYGVETVEIAAPGMNILSCVANGDYKSLTGTSMASPITAGAASLLFSVEPSASVKRIKNVLTFSANAKMHLYKKIKGAKRLNVNAAVRHLWFIMNWAPSPSVIPSGEESH